MLSRHYPILIPLTQTNCLVAVGLLVVHQFLQYGFHVRLPFADDYLDPVLSVPILLGLGEVERRGLSEYAESRGWSFRLDRADRSWPVLLGMTSGIAFVGEVIFPLLDSRSVADGYDFVAYAVGGLWVWLANRHSQTAGFECTVTAA